MARLDGKVALITRGARVQGAAEAARFAAAGATVYITDVLDDVGAATAADLGDTVTYLHHDVTSEDSGGSRRRHRRSARPDRRAGHVDGALTAERPVGGDTTRHLNDR